MIAVPASKIRIDEWTIELSSTDFCAYEGSGYDVAFKGKYRNNYWVGLRATHRRVDSRLPASDIAIDTLNFEAIDSKMNRTHMTNADYSPMRDIRDNEVTMSWDFVDTTGSREVDIPEDVDSIRVWFNAKVTVKTIDRTVTVHPVEMILVRRQTSSLGPQGWLIGEH